MLWTILVILTQKAWGCRWLNPRVCSGPLVFAHPAIKGIALYMAAALLLVGFLLAIAYKRPDPEKAR